jgi:hypothetical protein
LIPAKDFELSKQFYRDLGFTLCWGTEGDLAYFHYCDHGSHGKVGILLQLVCANVCLPKLSLTTRTQLVWRHAFVGEFLDRFRTF